MDNKAVALTKLIRTEVDRLSKGDVQDAPTVIANLKAGGLERGKHVGTHDLKGAEVLEWYGGQILDVLESSGWFAVNSIINSVDVFAPELKE